MPCHCVDFVGILSRHLINYSTSKYSKRIDYYFQLHPCSVLGTLNIIFWLHHKRSKVFLWPINCEKSRCIALHVITEDFRVRLHCSTLVLQAIALQGASIMKPIYVLTFVISKNYCFQMQVKPTFYTPLKVGVTFCIPKMRFTTTQNCWIDEKIMHKNCQKFGVEKDAAAAMYLVDFNCILRYCCAASPRALGLFKSYLEHSK